MKPFYPHAFRRKKWGYCYHACPSVRLPFFFWNTLEYDWTINQDVHNSFGIDLSFKMANWRPYLSIWFSALISALLMVRFSWNLVFSFFTKLTKSNYGFHSFHFQNGQLSAIFLFQFAINLITQSLLVVIIFW